MGESAVCIMYKASIKDQSFEVSVEKDEVKVNDLLLDWDIEKIDDRNFHIIKDHQCYRAELVSIDHVLNKVALKLNGKQVEVELKDKLSLMLERLGIDVTASAKLNEVKAPMPGLILEIQISEGDQVAKGDAIMILEAMKMENVLKSPGEGIVKAIKVKKGDSVEKNQVLVLF